MNRFLLAAKQTILPHCKTTTYKVITEGIYNVETGTTTNTETSYSVPMYKKHLRTDQYNFPALIGKESAMFYLVNDSLAFTPRVNDLVIFDSQTYTVKTIIEHQAAGDIILYKLVAAKG